MLFYWVRGEKRAKQCSVFHVLIQKSDFGFTWQAGEANALSDA